jgi:GTP-binding protein LepA
MELERERGITIKAQAVRLTYRAKDGQEYVLNLIDTPGHVDFNYEVSRSLAACEGALLVIDATQGIEAQTLANLYLALDHNLTIIPVINKIDLPSADPERVKAELAEVGIDPAEAILASAKTGVGTDDILQAVVDRIPAPKGSLAAPLRALIFDSHYDSYRGVIAYVRLMEGSIEVGDKFRMMSTGHDFEVTELAVFRPAMQPAEALNTGEVGCIISNIKEVKESRVGDTITGSQRPAEEPLPGFRKATPMVFCGLYPTENEAYEDLREALEKLQLNDAALVYEPETSAALGFGFRCGFLGLLHMEIIQERLEREYNLTLITTAPSVRFRVRQTDGTVVEIDNPDKLPPPTKIEAIAEPYVKGTVIVPTEFVGTVMELAREKRGNYKGMEYLNTERVLLNYSLPLAEILLDFFDKLSRAPRDMPRSTTSTRATSTATW